MSIRVSRNDDEHRYELLEDGERVGVADYRIEGDRVVMPHTVIDPSRRGEGLAGRLVRAALEDIRDGGRVVVPTCWYVAEYIDRHPEYADLLAT